MTSDEARFYAGHSPESDPADLRELLDALPGDVRPLLDAVAGLILDTAFVAPLGVVCPPDTADDVEGARLDMLAALMADPEPDWERVRDAYSTEEAHRVPSVVVSFPRGRPIEVAVDV
jgi:hypothetical protein